MVGSVLSALATLLHEMLTAALQGTITRPTLELTGKRIEHFAKQCRLQGQRHPSPSLSATSCCMLSPHSSSEERRQKVGSPRREA